MKKEILIDIFGDNTDYLYFGLKELKRAEKLTKNQTIMEVPQLLSTGEYKLDFILGLLKIGLGKCWAEKDRSLDDIEQKLEEAMEGENCSLALVATLLYEAIYATGFFKLPEAAKEKAKSLLKLLTAGDPQ